MATYLAPPPHERLNVFFGEFFRKMRKAPPQDYGQFLMRTEEEFEQIGYRDANPAGVENILIVRFDAIGDMILTSGFIREVRRNFPQAQITLVVYSDVRPVVELCPYVNEVLSLDRTFFGGTLVEVLEKIAVFCRDNLWHKKISVAFSPRWHNDTLPSLLLVWLSGARERIGYGTNPFKSWLGAPPPDVAAQDNFLLTKNITTPQDIIADGDKNFYLLAASGCEVNETHMELWHGAEDLQRARELLEDIPPHCKKIVIGIGASAPTKKYPVEQFLIALTELAKRDLVFVVVGSKDEVDEATLLEKNLPRGKVLNLVNKTALRETAAVISMADCYIGNDTGVLHMAAASKVPVVGIYRGAQDMENILPAIVNEFRRFPPWQTKAVTLRPEHPLDDCATLPPCYGFCHHREPHCITQITPQQIIDGFEKLMSL